MRRNLLFGSAVEIAKDPAAFLLKLSNNYGDVAEVRFAGKKYYFLQHPALLKHVLLNNYKQYSKPGSTKLLRMFLGGGVVTSNDGVWLEQRRLIQPFQFDIAENYIPAVKSNITLRPKEAIRLKLKKLTAWNMKTLLDKQINDQIISRIERLNPNLKARCGKMDISTTLAAHLDLSFQANFGEIMFKKDFVLGTIPAGIKTYFIRQKTFLEEYVDRQKTQNTCGFF